MRTYLTILMLSLACPLWAQLSVGNNGMTVLPNTPLSFEGLSLTPSASLSLGNNSIQRTSTPLANNPGITRLYQFGSLLLFSGRVSINYLTSELNGYSEPTLQVAYAPAPGTNLTVIISARKGNYIFYSLANPDLGRQFSCY